MADTVDLKSAAEKRKGSTPLSPTILEDENSDFVTYVSITDRIKWNALPPRVLMLDYKDYLQQVMDMINANIVHPGSVKIPESIYIPKCLLPREKKDPLSSQFVVEKEQPKFKWEKTTYNWKPAAAQWGFLVNSPNISTLHPISWTDFDGPCHTPAPYELEIVKQMNRDFPLDPIIDMIWPIFSGEEPYLKGSKWALGGNKSRCYGSIHRGNAGVFGALDYMHSRIIISAWLPWQDNNEKDCNQAELGDLDPFWVLVHEIVHATMPFSAQYDGYHGPKYVEAFKCAKEKLWAAMM